MVNLQEKTVMTQKRTSWRLVFFRLLAGLMVLFSLVEVLPNILGLFQPDSIPQEGPNPWVVGQYVAFSSILLAPTLVLLIWRPHRYLVLLQFFFISIIVSRLIAGIMFVRAIGEFPIPLIAFIGIAILIVALNPSVKLLFNFQPEGVISKPILFFTLVAAAFQIPWVIYNIQGWLNSPLGVEPSIDFLYGLVLPVLFLIGGTLSAFKKSGWKVFGVLQAICYLFLAIVAIINSGSPGSWGILGGIIGIVGGILLGVIMIWEINKDKKHSN